MLIQKKVSEMLKNWNLKSEKVSNIVNEETGTENENASNVGDKYSYASNASGLKTRNIVFVGNSWTFSSNPDGEGSLDPNAPQRVIYWLNYYVSNDWIHNRGLISYDTPSIDIKGKHSESLKLTTEGGKGTKYWAAHKKDITSAVNDCNAYAVSLMFGSADLKLYKKYEKKPQDEDNKAVSPDEFRKNLKAICEYIGKKCPSVVYIFVHGPGYSPKADDQYLNYFNKYKNKYKFKKVGDAFNRINAEISNLGLKKGKDGTYIKSTVKFGNATYIQGYIGAYTYFRNNYEKTIGDDGTHYNDIGRDYLAKQWADAMYSKL